jgi:hypothetical protein
VTRVADKVIDWLLEGDPAIRWQVMRDLQDRPRKDWEPERAKVASEGWGAALLAEQAPDGSWGGGLYGPKWTSTFYTLFQLTAFGLPRGNPQASAAATLLFEKGLCADGGLRLWGNHLVRPSRQGRLGEICETGMGLSMLANYLPRPGDAQPVAECLLAAQTPDGGWNCQRSSNHGSFHTSISVLEGMRERSASTGGSPRIEEAADRGREFFLNHQMYRSHRTGEVVKDAMTRFTFPYHWYFDVLRGLDYFQSVDAARDERLADAIKLLESRRQADGRWPMQNRHHGKEYFVLEPNGEPSRWNTLRALRVLRWWDQR